MLTPGDLDGIDGHRTLGDKSGLAGKRDAAQEEDVRTGLLLTHEDAFKGAQFDQRILIDELMIGVSSLNKHHKVRFPPQLWSLTPVMFLTGALRIADGDMIHTLLDFLSYLKLKGKNITSPFVSAPLSSWITLMVYFSLSLVQWTFCSFQMCHF